MLTQTQPIFRSKQNKLPGTNYKEVYKKAKEIYAPIERKTKRQPYLRSAYFKKRKIFFSLFWKHLFDQQPYDRARRLKYLACAVDLIVTSKILPSTKPNPNKKSELLHRFTGKSHEGSLFYVQIKEDTGKKRLNLISIFPESKQ